MAASKKKAKPKPKAKAKPKATPVELARKGDVDALFELMDLETDSDNDRLAYKWLNAASDFGHGKKADPLIDDVLEVSSLRYDDDRYETSAAHWELALGYLTGDEGLPIDLKLAKRHLGEAFALHDFETVTGEKSAKVLKRLDGKAKALLEDAIANAGQGGDSDDE